jgi:hypothetical protein
MLEAHFFNPGFYNSAILHFFKITPLSQTFRRESRGMLCFGAQMWGKFAGT